MCKAFSYGLKFRYKSVHGCTWDVGKYKLREKKRETTDLLDCQAIKICHMVSDNKR